MAKKTNTAAPTNANAALSNAISEMATIRQEVAKSENHRVGRETTLRNALAQVYVLTRRLRSEETLQLYVRGETGKWSKTADANPFQPMVVLAFKDSQKASISKYATVLNYADTLQVDDDKIVEWLKGGIEELAEQARRAEVPKQSEYDETEQEKLDRALQVLSASAVGKSQTVAPALVPDIADAQNASPNISDFRQALVRVVDGKVQIVQITPSSASELTKSILAVAPTSTHAPQRLAAKPLYDVFRACDLFSRLNKDEDDAGYDQKRTYQLSTDAKGEIDFEAWEASIRDTTEHIKSKRFRLARGLRFFHDGQSWSVESVSNELTFAGIRMKLGSTFEEIPLDRDYFLAARQARRIAAEFRYSGNWTIRVRGRKELGRDVAGDRELVLDPFVPSQWRHLNADTTDVNAFDMTPHRAAAVLSWPKQFKADTGGSIPKLLGVVANADGVAVSILLDGVSGPTFERLLGRLTSKGDFEKLAQERRIKRDDVLTLSAISSDYAAAFQLTFGRGNEGMAALVAKAFDGEIHVPLVISKAGDYAEIAEAVMACNQDEKSVGGSEPTTAE